nr:hypothetical protein [Tanacetum cinerariifolium]
KQHQHEVNEIRAENIAKVANPLALVAQQQQVYHPQTHPTHFNQHSSTRTHQAATKNKGKAVVNSPQPIYDQEPSMVDDDEDTSKDKEIDKLMALISLSFKKIYKPTNNNLRTSSNTSRANHDNSSRIHRNAGYEGQRSGTVAGARETVDAQNVSIESVDMSYDSEQIDQNEEDIDLAKEQMKDKLSAHQETISILLNQNEAQIKLYKTREDKELEKVIELENKVKKAHRANPRLYDIGCYNDNLALMLAPDTDEVIRIEKESRSKLSDLIRPFDYDKLNNLYDLFVTQREKSSEQRYFSERSRLSHINVNNGK